MAGSSFGRIFRITTWGESHGPALGCVIDGCPAGVELSEADIQPFLDRRKPGNCAVATSRKESDECEILSGVFEGKTTGTPISVIIRNSDMHSGDYDELRSVFRPGHADMTYDAKYGIRDHRGGGRSSGRETAARVIAGAIASKVLAVLGISVEAYTRSIGPVEADMDEYSRSAVLANATAMPDITANAKALEYIADMKNKSDSCGGVMECMVKGVPAGIGDPVFDKLDALLAQAAMSIGAVKAVEIGDGTLVAKSLGSKNNDQFKASKGNISKKTNHAGGILGGISDSSDIIVRCSVKPTPSIARSQKTVNVSGENTEIEIKGRHDPVIVPRAVVVLESMCAITILDCLMYDMSSRMENLVRIYNN
ncbi:MAG: chorismate synthase [Lachnospiraceae bacterium]|nr:chorismate synthase [Lachnospiraceae bacterium]